MHLRAEFHVVVAIDTKNLLDNVAGTGHVDAVGRDFQTQHVAVSITRDR